MELLPSMFVWFSRLWKVTAVVSALGLGALYAFQEKLLYVPKIPGIPDEFAAYPNEFGLEHEELWLKSADGVNLYSWHVWPSGTAPGTKLPVVLFFQENAGNMSFRLPFIALLIKHLRCAVFVLGYRGYGKSEGSPSQAGLEMDAETALRHVRERLDVDPARIVVYGKSLGGAVALHMVSKHESHICAAVIENSFLSVPEMVPRVFPFLGFAFGRNGFLNFLVRNKWRNRDCVRQITSTPMLLIASMKDELVPFEHMQHINNLAVTKHKVWAECPNSGHMDAYEADAVFYWQTVKSFWAQFVQA